MNSCYLKRKGRPYTCRQLWPKNQFAWCVGCGGYPKQAQKTVPPHKS